MCVIKIIALYYTALLYEDTRNHEGKKNYLQTVQPFAAQIQLSGNNIESLRHISVVVRTNSQLALLELLYWSTLLSALVLFIDCCVFQLV